MFAPSGRDGACGLQKGMQGEPEGNARAGAGQTAAAAVPALVRVGHFRRAVPGLEYQPGTACHALAAGLTVPAVQAAFRFGPRRFRRKAPVQFLEYSFTYESIIEEKITCAR